LGPEIDLGGNEDRLWMWVRRSEPAAVFVCQRNQFELGSARGIMPVDPAWFPQALGLVEIQEHAQHQLRLLPDANLELVSTMPASGGAETVVRVIDPTRAWVLQQYAYDTRGQLVASAVASQHRYFPEQQVSLPTRVEVRVPPAQLALGIDLGQVYLNSALGDPGQLWAPPRIDGYPQVEIGSSAPGETPVATGGGLRPPARLAPRRRWRPQVRPSSRHPRRPMPSGSRSIGFRKARRRRRHPHPASGMRSFRH
jgi:hypothetical protein